MRKRGISKTIVIVILVALVLAAIGVFWFVIKNLISESTEGTGEYEGDGNETGEICGNGICNTTVEDESNCPEDCLDLILSGTIDSVWPGDAPKYFDSTQLPIDGSETNLVLKYINFSSQNETGCVKILDVQRVYDIALEYDKTHVQLERVANIISGDNFSIYNSNNCGAI